MHFAVSPSEPFLTRGMEPLDRINKIYRIGMA